MADLHKRTAKSLGALWDAVVAIVDPRLDPEGHRSLIAEQIEHNVRSARWFLATTLVGHLILLGQLFLPATTPAQAAWHRGVAILHAGLGAFAAVGAVIARSSRARALHRYFGDVVGAVYVIGCGAINANVLRVTGYTYTPLLLGALTVAFIFAVRPWLYLGSLLLGAAIVVAAVHRLGGDRVILANGTATTVVVVLFSAGAFLAARSVRIREHALRLRAAELNAELERRVEQQVQEIVARAREIEALNTQLNQKITDRSRELSMALARLAQEHQPLEPGTVLGGRAEVEALIGQGGMGNVYRGRDLVTGKSVAIKTVQAGSTSELDGLYRFLREAQAMARLNHRAIVRSIHVDVSDDGRLFQMMELVDGEPLDRYLARSEVIPWPLAARLGDVLAEALATAHAAQVVHRDIKPSNVMLTREPPGLKLLDFGISKLRDARANAHGATRGVILGTPEFLAPEQVSEPERVDGRADVYAFGILLYCCVAGRLPYDAEGARSLLIAHAVRAPADLTEAAPGVDPRFATLVMSCLNKDPDERPTAADLSRALADLAAAVAAPPLTSLDVRPPDPEPRRAPATLMRKRTASGAIVAPGAAATQISSGGGQRKTPL